VLGVGLRAVFFCEYLSDAVRSYCLPSHGLFPFPQAVSPNRCPPIPPRFLLTTLLTFLYPCGCDGGLPCFFGPRPWFFPLFPVCPNQTGGVLPRHLRPRIPAWSLSSPPSLTPGPREACCRPSLPTGRHPSLREAGLIFLSGRSTLLDVSFTFCPRPDSLRR